jgi:phosphotransacetylase
VRSLLRSGLAEEVPAAGEAADLAWPVGGGDGALVLRATAVGLARITDGADDAARLVAIEKIAEAAAVSTQTESDASNELTASVAPTTTIASQHVPRTLRLDG